MTPIRQLPTVTSQAMRESGTRVFSPAGMTASLTPALALAYLHELSLDVRAAVVLDPAGRPLVGDADLAPRVRDLLASPEAAAAPAGSLLAARAPDGGAIAVLTGSRALMSLVEHDLAKMANALVTVPETASERPAAD
jgi:hypothetical protein